MTLDHILKPAEADISRQGSPVQEFDQDPSAVSALIAVGWLDELSEALSAGDDQWLSTLFVDDSYWRDLAALSADIGWIHGAREIGKGLFAAADEFHPAAFRLAPWATAPRYVTRATRHVLETFFEFSTDEGDGRGVFRLVPDPDSERGMRAWTMLTAVHDLRGHEERPPGQRIPGLGFDRSDTRTNWLDRRHADQSYDDREPQVLVIGGGHSGTMIAGRLKQLDIDTLIVDRFPRIGDNWRTRYSSLALHNETDVCHFPYLPFPGTFPQYLAKDKLANWFEIYVEALELNYWAATEFVRGRYDEAGGRWAATVRRADGTQRTLRPTHIVVATGGVGGTPNIPTLPGEDEFAGPIVHTKHFVTGAAYAGQRVLVVGVGTSGHDVAFDLYNNGAQVTLMQRSPTTIINIDTANLLFGHYTSGISTDEGDLIGAANFIYPILTDSLRAQTAMTADRDAELLKQLERVGLRLDQGVDETGYLMKFFRDGGGYYINVGCSELVAAGQIKLLQTSELSSLVADGVRRRDGTVEEFDGIILATGYLNQQTEVRTFFGDEVADRVGPICGIDERGEIRNGWRSTAQTGLWFMVGGFGQGRIYSMPAAVQIARATRGNGRKAQR